jgi:hypothetical protein
MKNKIVLASAFLAASSFSTAEIVVNDFLSFEGFVDMSYTSMSGDDEVGIYGNPADGKGYSDNSFAVDQVEISWLFDFDPVTAQIDLNYLGDQATNDASGEVEQAFATYHMDNGSAITAGRYASMLGFEAYEPTGLYQYSTAYDVATLVGPSYGQGVKYTHETNNTFFGISVQDTVTGLYQGRLGGNDNGNPLNDDGGFGIEAAGSYAMENGLTFFLGGAVEDGDDGDSYVINTYATFETGAWIFAAELNYGETENDPYGIIANLGGTAGDTEIFSALLMANFAYSENASITGRVSYIDADQEVQNPGFSDVQGDLIKYTLAHGYAFTDNLFLVTEVSYADGEVDGSTGGLGDGDFDQLLGAVELIFSF